MCVVRRAALFYLVSCFKVAKQLFRWDKPNRLDISPVALASYPLVAAEFSLNFAMEQITEANVIYV